MWSETRRRTFERHSVLLHRVDGCVRNHGLATLQDGGHADFFPLNWDLKRTNEM